MRKNRHREKLKMLPFPEDWRRILEERFPLYHNLPPSDRAELHGHIQVFLAEKSFEGCGGLQLTDEMRICIAAQACVLLLHRATDYYPDLRSILVYPGMYAVETTRHLGMGVFHEGHESRLGEAWETGAVVLAWDAVKAGTVNPGDGHNVVFHEFAHQLDFEDGYADGAPLLGAEVPWHQRRERYRSWARVLSREFEQLRAEVAAGQESLLDGYGAKDPAEFFAVATESFFEAPKQMQQRHPALYEELKKFYRQDPASWHGESGNR